MLEVTRWIAENCDFDRIYFYGRDRPLHVSWGPQCSHQVFELSAKSGRRIPRRLPL
jgi:hypothetical protein